MISSGQIFNGTFQAGFALFYGAKFVNDCRFSETEVLPTLVPEVTASERLLNQVSTGINAIGAIARFGDWVVEQKWLIVGAVQAIALKILAHLTGVFYYLKRAVDTIEILEEIERFTGLEQRMSAYSETTIDSFEVYKYALWTNLFSSIILGVYSGIELASLITGAVILTPAVLSTLLTAGFVTLVVSTLFQFSSDEAIKKLPFLRAESAQNYHFLHG